MFDELPGGSNGGTNGCHGGGKSPLCELLLSVMIAHSFELDRDDERECDCSDIDRTGESHWFLRKCEPRPVSLLVDRLGSRGKAAMLGCLGAAAWLLSLKSTRGPDISRGIF